MDRFSATTCDSTKLAGQDLFSVQARARPSGGLAPLMASSDCTSCSSCSQCTRSKQEPRIISLQTRDLHEALQTMRKRQTTEEFRKSYAPRAGIESTHAQAIRRSGLRRTRYRGLVKTRLQHVITAVAINLLRIASWANGTPLVQTRSSHFAALQFNAA